MDENPFVNDNPIEVVELFQNETKTDEKKNTSYSFSKVYNADQKYSTKVYRNKANEELIYSLSPPGMKLFFYIILHLNKKKDTIELLEDKISKLTGIKSSSFRNARSEVVKKGIIKKTKGRSKMYWINPHIIFAGNRSNYYPENLDVKSKLKVT